MGEPPVSVLHGLWLLTRTLCILLHPQVSTGLAPGLLSLLSSRPERTRISCYAALTNARVFGFR
jgi:hypothetical protein